MVELVAEGRETCPFLISIIFIIVRGGGPGRGSGGGGLRGMEAV